MDLLATARNHLERLVAFDSTSTQTNAALVSWLAEHLDRPGVHVWDLPEAVTRAETGDEVVQHNLLVRIGPEAPGALVLSAHTDCVPVTGQPWTSDPFEVVERDGRLVGRGTCDMKGFIASALAVTDRVDPTALDVPIVLALSHSEELGTIGAPSLVDALRANVEDASVALVGEPTMMEVVGAHKGVQGAWVRITGVDAHSSQPQLAASANLAAARLMTFVAELAGRHEVEGPHDDRFVPPMTTFNVGMVRGGQAINIVPRECRFHFEFRPIPAVSSTEIVAELEQYAQDVVLPELGRHVGTDKVSITVTTDAHVLPLEPEPDGAAEELARACGAGGERGHTVAYGTDGGWLQSAGLSVVVCGPGSIDQAHKADEFLAIDQLAACNDFLEAAVRRQAVER